MRIQGARETTHSKDIEFIPEDLSLGEPKEGTHDDEEHSGGNTYAGGVHEF